VGQGISNRQADISVLSVLMETDYFMLSVYLWSFLVDKKGERKQGTHCAFKKEYSHLAGLGIGS